MNINLVKKISGVATTYLVVVNNEKVFYILDPPQNKPKMEEEYWNEDIGTFKKYSVVEANILKLLEPGCSETSWLELLVVRGIAKEDLEANLTLMLSIHKDDTSI
jgi:hypothetical protein